MKIHTDSSWSKNEIINFLERAKIPLRMSCLGNDGYPTVCSLWFFYNDGCLWSASHENAYILRLLRKNRKVGFEVATNEYPYKGVRGYADVELVKAGSDRVLGRLIGKYLGDSNKKLADWLMSRVDQEYTIKAVPVSINSWDFSNRMKA